MNSPHAPRFSFLANSAKEDDKSGAATWTISCWQRGEWFDETFRIHLASFETAHMINKMLAAAFEGGDAQGYAELKRKVLEVLV